MSWPADGSNETGKEGSPGNGSEGTWKQRSSEDSIAPQLTSSVSNGSESPASKRKRPNSYSPKPVSVCSLSERLKVNSSSLSTFILKCPIFLYSLNLLLQDSGEEQSQWDQDDSDPEIITPPNPIIPDERNYGNMMSRNTSQVQFAIVIFMD